MKTFLLNENKQIKGVRILIIFNFLGWARLLGRFEEIFLGWAHSVDRFFPKIGMGPLKIIKKSLHGIYFFGPTPLND